MNGTNWRRAATTIFVILMFASAAFYSNALPSSNQVCDPTGQNCIKGESWNTHYNLLIFKYDSVGGKTSQVKGGYHTEWHFCWLWGFIPWACSKSAGSNALSVSTDFYLKSGPPPIVGKWTTLTAFLQNTDAVQVERRSFTFSWISTPEQQLVGACSNHDGNAMHTQSSAGICASGSIP